MPRKKGVYAAETDVPIARTKTQIEEELMKHGATSFISGSIDGKVTILFELKERRIRFDLPLTLTASEAQKRSRWRALYLSIKARLVSVVTGIETFEEAFLAHVVLADGQSVYDAVRGGIEQQYQTGKIGPLLLEGPKK